ncbi:MAG: hypothetical protein NVS1B11_36740 [Terriglobales bacterium]
MRILAIDPGTTKSGWCLWDQAASKISDFGIHPNEAVLDLLPGAADFLALEMIASYGMAVGESTFETCVWIGRFVQQWHRSCRPPALLVKRKEILSHHCHSAKAKDANLSQALRDRLGEKGTKKSPGPTFGMSSHVWSALGLALYISDRMPYLQAIKAKS